MSLQYSGSIIINRTATLVTRLDHVNFVSQALYDAGWITISGTPGNVGVGGNTVHESPPGNQGQKCRVVCSEPNSGNCAQYFIRHVSGSPSSQTFWANPVGSWRIVATKFHFFAFVSGSASRITPRTFVAGGTIYVPSFMPITPGDCAAFMTANTNSDTDAVAKSSFRSTLRPYDSSNNNGLFTGLIGSSMVNMSSYSNQDGGPSINVWQGGYNAQSTSSYRWSDGTLPAYEPLMCWGQAGVSTEAKIQGILYDAMVLNDAFISETVITYDGHTWIALTDQANTNAIAARATLFLAVT